MTLMTLDCCSLFTGVHAYARWRKCVCFSVISVMPSLLLQVFMVYSFKCLVCHNDNSVFSVQIFGSFQRSGMPTEDLKPQVRDT